jgi:hypothetical protein
MTPLQYQRRSSTKGAYQCVRATLQNGFTQARVQISLGGREGLPFVCSGYVKSVHYMLDAATAVYHCVPICVKYPRHTMKFYPMLALACAAES